jgi:DedD protein
MDSGLKKRLLGAAVLIALAVIFVPMLLPSRSGTEPLSTDVPPPPSSELQTRVLQVGPDSASAGSSTAASIVDPDRVASLDLNGGTHQTATVAPGATAVTPLAASSAAETEATGAAAAPSTKVASAEPKPIPSAPEPAEPVAGGAGAAAGTVYTVNLGIYADHGSARRLVADAKRHGFTAVATPETFRGKSVLRVRVGPFSSKAAAEAARLKLKDFEHVAMSVDTASVDKQGDAPASALPASTPGGWAVQLAAFSDQSSAENLRDRLRRQGFDGYVDSVKTSKGTLWRVRAGPFATREVAESARGRIADEIKIKGNVVTE